MAGTGYKTFVNGDELPASEVNGYLMDQSVMFFADEFDRDVALPVGMVSEGMQCYLGDLNVNQTYSGSAWQITGGQMPIRDMSKTTTQSIASGNTNVTVTGYGTTNIGRGITYANGVFTVVYSGVYTITAAWQMTANTTGRRRIALLVNSSEILANNQNAPSTGNAYINIGQTAYFTAGDTVAVAAIQNSGAALDITTARFSMAYIGA